MPTDPGPYIHFKLSDTFYIEDFLEQNYPGLIGIPRTIEDALRRGQLRFYQVGQKRYTTPMLIDEWVQTLVTSAGA